MSKKFIAIKVGVPLSTVVLSCYLCLSALGFLDAFTELGPQNTMRSFSAEIRSGVLQYEEVANRIDAMARAEEKVSAGAKQLKVSFYALMVLGFCVAALQALALRFGAQLGAQADAEKRRGLA